MTDRVSHRVLWVLTIALSAGIFAPTAVLAEGDGARAALARLKKYDTRYYAIHTDLEIERVREAAARLTTMAEEYHQRTKGFSGAIRHRLPFYLFSRREDYQLAGGLPGSAGVFMRRGRHQALMAIAGADGRFWRVIQHEGFHQFASNVISPRLPVWVNEGLAEYFGHGLWTGDGYVTGVIEPGRLRRVKAMIRDGKLLSFRDMLTMSHQEWNAQLAIRNYDQGWSMLHFLVHGDDGKYRRALENYIRDVSRGAEGYAAFLRRFGRDHDAFRKRYSEWWLAQEEDPTARLRTEAVVRIAASYLARCGMADVEVQDAKALLKAMAEGEIRVDGRKYPDLWLPTSLGKEAAGRARPLGTWKLISRGRGARPKLQLTRPDGAVYTATYRSRGNRRPDIDVGYEPAEESDDGTPSDSE